MSTLHMDQRSLISIICFLLIVLTILGSAIVVDGVGMIRALVDTGCTTTIADPRIVSTMSNKMHARRCA